MTQYVELDAFDNVHGYVEAEEQPERLGYRYEVQDPPVSGWPVAPFGRAVLRRTDGVTYWHDPRTTDEKAADARAQRDALLLGCDWIVTRALEQSQAVPSAWLTYRQALRDLPQQPGFPAVIDWPTSPTD